MRKLLWEEKITHKGQVLFVMINYEEVKTYCLLLVGLGKKPKPMLSAACSFIVSVTLSWSPQCTSVQLGPQPTLKDRPLNRAASISKRPFPTVTEPSRGTGPPSLRAPTVRSVGSGVGAGNMKDGPNDGHGASDTSVLLSFWGIPPKGASGNWGKSPPPAVNFVCNRAPTAMEKPLYQTCSKKCTLHKYSTWENNVFERSFECSPILHLFVQKKIQ